MDIRHIAVAPDGQRAVLGAFARSVEVVDIDTGSPISKFDTVLDAGGSRLAIALAGKVVVAAAYEREGIAGYDAETGSLIWHRRDIKKAQALTSSPRAEHVYVGLENSPACLVDASTGATISRFKGVRRFVESAFGPLLYLDGLRPVVVSTDTLEPAFRMDRFAFAFLSAVFSPDQLAIAGVGGEVRCYDVKTGDVSWNVRLPDGIHCLKLGFSDAAAAFFGVIWPFQKGGDKQLVRFSARGAVQPVAGIRQPAAVAFEPRTAALLTSDRIRFDPVGMSVRPMGVRS